MRCHVQQRHRHTVKKWSLIGLATVLALGLAWVVMARGARRSARVAPDRSSAMPQASTVRRADADLRINEAGSTSAAAAVVEATLRPHPGGNVASDNDPNQAPPNPMESRIAAYLAHSRTGGDLDPVVVPPLAWVGTLKESELAAAAAVLTHPAYVESGRVLRSTLLQNWAQVRPGEASDWVRRMSAGAMRSDALSDVARGWARGDMDAALAWARSLPEEADRGPALEHALYELAEREPVKALAAALEMPATAERESVLRYAANQWAAEAPEAAVEWAAQIPDSRLRERVLSEVLAAWGDQDPWTAAAKAVQTLRPGRAQNDAVVSIVQRWAQTDPRTAGAWVSAFPAGELAETAGAELVRLWSDQDSEKAASWLNSLPPGSTRDASIAAFVEKLIPWDPASAVIWAADIGEPRSRTLQMERAAEEWLAVDGTVAREWLAVQQGLPDSIRARLVAGTAAVDGSR